MALLKLSQPIHGVAIVILYPFLKRSGSIETPEESLQLRAVTVYPFLKRSGSIETLVQSFGRERADEPRQKADFKALELQTAKETLADVFHALARRDGGEDTELAGGKELTGRDGKLAGGERGIA